MEEKIFNQIADTFELMGRRIQAIEKRLKAESPSFNVEGAEEFFEALSTQKHANNRFRIKASSISTPNTSYPVRYIENRVYGAQSGFGFDLIQRRLNTEPLNERFVTVPVYTNTNPSPDASVVAESATKPNKQGSFTATTFEAKTIAVVAPVTNQQLRYFPNFMQFLERLLTIDVQYRLHDQILTDLGPYLVEFNEAAHSGTVPQANVYDLAGLMELTYYTSVAQFSNSPDDMIFVFPKQYIIPLKYSKNLIANYNYNVPLTTFVEETIADRTTSTTGHLLNGALVTLMLSEEISVSWGFVNDQFAKNEQTIRVELDYCVVPHSTFVGVKESNVATALSTINKP
jgi:hypothetical protein